MIHEVLKAVWQRKGQWFYSWRFALINVISINRTWLIVYAFLSIAICLLHKYVPGTVALKGLDFLWLAAPLLCGWLVRQGEVLLERNCERRFPQGLMIGLTLASLLIPTYLLLRLSIHIEAITPTVSVLAGLNRLILHIRQDLILSSLFVGLAAWLFATFLIAMIISILGVVFNKDFAPLSMFKFSNEIRKLSGLMLFFIAVKQLLFWPNMAIVPTQALDYFEFLTKSPLTGTEIAQGLDLFSQISDYVILAVFVGGVAYLSIKTYRLLAYSILRGLTQGLWKKTFYLVQLSILERLKGSRDRTVWPSCPNLFRATHNVDSDFELDEYSFTTAFAAYSLAFGLWVPRLFIPNKDLGLILYRVDIVEFLILTLFVLGSVDVWLQTIEVAYKRGIFYTLGVWCGSSLLFWPTLIIAITGISDLIDYSSIVGAAPLLRKVFVIFYQCALGVVALLLAFNQANRPRSANTPRQYRIIVATTATLILIGFTFQTVTDLSWTIPSALITVLTLGYILFRLSQLGNRPFRHQQLQARLVASPTMAFAPLLFDEDTAIEWDSRVANLAVFWIKNITLMKQPMQLYVQVVGSEEQAAYEALRRAKFHERGLIDFVITDLHTALEIIGQLDQESGFGRQKINYKILAVVGHIPWEKIETRIPRKRLSPNYRFTLDPGFLPYLTPERAFGTDQVRYWYRSADFATVAEYGFSGGDVESVYLPGPYASWLKRMLNIRDQTAERACQPSETTYVLLVKDDNRAKSSAYFNWNRVLCDTIANGQRIARDSQKVLNNQLLQKLQAFLAHATQHRIDFLISDLYSSLVKCHFTQRFVHMSNGRAKGYYEQAVSILRRYNLLSRDDLNKLISPEVQRRNETVSNLLKYKQPGIKQQKLDDFLDKRQDQFILDAERAILRPLYEPAFVSLLDSSNFFERHFYDNIKEELARRNTGEFVVTPYLVNVAIIIMADYPGELARLLSSDRMADCELSLLSTVNLGDTTLVYALDRCYVDEFFGQGKKHPPVGEPILVGDRVLSANWEKKAAELRQHEGFEVQSLQAIMVRVEHKPHGLVSVLEQLKTPEGLPDLNIEQAFAFPVSQRTGVVLMVFREDDWEQAINRFLNNTSTPRQDRQFNVRCTEVILGPFSLRRHQYEVVFESDSTIPLKAQVSFSVRKELWPTWTFTWGSVQNWIAEFDYCRLRLKVPTELGLRVAVGDLLKWLYLHRGYFWLTRGRLGAQARPILAPFLSGLIGKDAYQETRIWKASINV